MDQTISKGFVFLENAPELMRLLEDIFTDDFMQEYTRFESFEGFRYSSAVMVLRASSTVVTPFSTSSRQLSAMVRY